MYGSLMQWQLLFFILKYLCKISAFHFTGNLFLLITVVNLFSDKKNNKKILHQGHVLMLSLWKRKKKKENIRGRVRHYTVTWLYFMEWRSLPISWLLRRYSSYLYSHLRVPTKHFIVLHICPKHLLFISCHMSGVWRHFKGIFCKLVSLWFLIVVYCYWRCIQNVFFNIQYLKLNNPTQLKVYNWIMLNLFFH